MVSVDGPEKNSPKQLQRTGSTRLCIVDLPMILKFQPNTFQIERGLVVFSPPPDVFLIRSGAGIDNRIKSAGVLPVQTFILDVKPVAFNAAHNPEITQHAAF